jgi:serine protease
LGDDFGGEQGYFCRPPRGTDAAWARTVAGGDGAGIMVVDLEYDWFLDHEDLRLPSSARIGSGEGYGGYGDDHGTAVLGQLGGRDNGFGVTGGVPAAELRVIGPMYRGYVPANAIAEAAALMAPGDVLVIEQQYTGPTGTYVPLEVLASVFDATLSATLAGRVVVAAAGNGGQDLDAPAMGGLFDRRVRDSGAIIVGAGDPLHARLSFSSFGSRVDLQGWGQRVATTGYGGLYGRSPYDRYTGTFSGTSSATPIVAAAVAAVQGRRKALGLPVLSPAAVAALLRDTGTPQTGDGARSIGPFPNLRAAFAALEGPAAR